MSVGILSGQRFVKTVKKNPVEASWETQLVLVKINNTITDSSCKWQMGMEQQNKWMPGIIITLTIVCERLLESPRTFPANVTPTVVWHDFCCCCSRVFGLCWCYCVPRCATHAHSRSSNAVQLKISSRTQPFYSERTINYNSWDYKNHLIKVIVVNAPTFSSVVAAFLTLTKCEKSFALAIVYSSTSVVTRNLKTMRNQSTWRKSSLIGPWEVQVSEAESTGYLEQSSWRVRKSWKCCWKSAKHSMHSSPWLLPLMRNLLV